MPKLYHKLKGNDGSKIYACAVRGKHVWRVYKTASAAQRHSEAVQARLQILKAARVND